MWWLVERVIIRSVCYLPDYFACYGLFLQSGFLCYGAWGEYISYRLWGCFVVGVYGCNDGWSNIIAVTVAACTVSSASSIGDDDVSDIYGVCDESGAKEESGETRVL